MILRKLDANRAAEMVEEKGAKMDREFAALPNSLCLRCDNDFFGCCYGELRSRVVITHKLCPD